MKYFFAVLFLVPGVSFGACQVSDVLPTLIPGGQWTITNNDPATLVVKAPDTVPTTLQINQAVSTCQSNQAQLAAYAVELSTTQQSLIGKTTSYVASSAVAQLQTNSKLARIAELKALLGQ